MGTFVNMENYANAETPVPGMIWFSTDESRRLEIVAKAMENGPSQFLSRIEIVGAKEDGEVIARLRSPLAAGDRGTLLLDFEEYLKKTIDEGLTVWLEPMGDRNSLRNLRGIEVKS